MLITALILGVAGCSNNLEKFTTKSSMDAYYADEELLNQMTEKGYVDYRLSRYFACAEISETASDFGWSNVTISERPVIIYNSITDEPKYYEFRVSENGAEVGAVSCVAVKTDGSPVKYILPYAKEVKSDSANRSLIGGSHFIDSGYPVKLSVKGNSSRAVNAETGEEITEPETDASGREFIEYASQEMLEELGLTSQEKIDEYLASFEEEEKQLENLWEEIEKNAELILEQNCDELLAEVVSGTCRSATCNSEAILKLPKWDAVKKMVLSRWVLRTKLCRIYSPGIR